MFDIFDNFINQKFVVLLICKFLCFVHNEMKKFSEKCKIESNCRKIGNFLVFCFKSCKFQIVLQVTALN